MSAKLVPSALGLFLLPIVGCFSGSTTLDADDWYPELRSPPDVLGDWDFPTLRGSTFLSGTPTVECNIDAFGVSLAHRTQAGDYRYDLSGSHTGFEMLCRGFTEYSAAAVLDLADTVVVVAPGGIGGTLSADCQFLQGCAWFLSMKTEGFSLSTIYLTRTAWDGYLFWPDTSPLVRASFRVDKRTPP